MTARAAWRKRFIERAKDQKYCARAPDIDGESGSRDPRHRRTALSPLQTYLITSFLASGEWLYAANDFVLSLSQRVRRPPNRASRTRGVNHLRSPH